MSTVSSPVAAVTWIVYSLIMQTYAKHPTWWSPSLATLDPGHVTRDTRDVIPHSVMCDATRRKREVCLCLITTITSCPAPALLLTDHCTSLCLVCSSVGDPGHTQAIPSCQARLVTRGSEQWTRAGVGDSETQFVHFLKQ